MFGWANTLWSQAMSWLSLQLTSLRWFFNGFVFLLEKVVQLAGLAVQTILLATEILASVAIGIVHTFAGLASASPTAQTIGTLSPGMAFVVGLLDPLGFQVVGYLMAALVWIAGALVLLRMI